MIVLIKAWDATDASRELAADLDAARVSCGLTRQQYCGLLGVSQSRLSEMEAGLDAGPGVLRYAHLPAAFWIAFLKTRAVRFALRVIEDTLILKQIDWLNRWMVRTMKRDAARIYPGEAFPEIPDEPEEEKRTA